jgi:hypothetical protein
MREPKQRIGRRPAAYFTPQEFPKLLYHCQTGQIRKVYSADEEEKAGAEWGPPQLDVRTSRKPMIDDNAPPRAECPVVPIELQENEW